MSVLGAFEEISMQQPLHMYAAYMPGIPEILIIAVVLVVLFGRGKISGVMGEVASGIKAFQKGMRDDEPNRIETAATASTAPEMKPVEPRKDV
jgi:sec-independent protein translocase protein TatA